MRERKATDRRSHRTHTYVWVGVEEEGKEGQGVRVMGVSTPSRMEERERTREASEMVGMKTLDPLRRFEDLASVSSFLLENTSRPLFALADLDPFSSHSDSGSLLSNSSLCPPPDPFALPVKAKGRR